jgi:hypothetical protein
MCLEFLSCLTCKALGKVGEVSTGVNKKLEPYKLHLTRIAYATFLLISFILALFFRDGFFGLLEKLPVFREGCKLAENQFSSSCVGKNAVYRISFSLVLFYSLNAFLASKLFFVGDRIRLFIQHNLFFLKYPLFAGFLVFPFFIPNGFFIVYAWIALIMSGIFIIIQIVLLIDFAYDWQKRWAGSNIEEEGFKIWDYLLVFLSVILFIIAIGFSVANFVVFGSGGSCHLNRFIICFTIILGFFGTIASLLLRRGIVPPAVITAFCSFMCWSALMSDPSPTCNILKQIPSTNFVFDIITIVLGILLASISLLRSAVTTSLTKLWAKPDEETVEPASDDEELIAEKNAEECRELFWSHVVYMFSSFYMCMVLVSWTIDTTGHASWKIEESIAAVWVKIGSSWITFLLFGWTLIAPYILTCRTFEHNKFDN